MEHISTPSIKEEDYNKYGNNLESRMSIPTSVSSVTYQKDLKTYVNSQNKTLYVEAEDYHEHIRLINMQGVLIKKFHANKFVDISQLQQGVYLLTAYGAKTSKLLLN
jgi:hypothetical protein